MAYKKAIPEKKREIHVSNTFLNEYMPYANGNFVKVYLLGLSQCTEEKAITQKQMADKLSLLESDVIMAWNYWAEQKVVKFDGENVEFLDLDVVRSVKIIDTKPVYSADEIFATSTANKQLGDMFRMVEKILEKPLSSNDLTVLYSLYDYYRLPIEVIPMLITYCIKNGKKSMRYIEKTAAIWVEKGINSIDSAEKYLKKAEEYNKAISKLKNSMGVVDRNFSPTELKYINSWLYDMKMPFDLIMSAFDLSTTNTGKLSVKYMDKVLSNWYNAGATTLKKVKQYAESFSKPTENKSKATPTKFTNFDQPDYDFDAFERKSIGRTKKNDIQ